MTITYNFSRSWDEYHDESYEYEYTVPYETLKQLADEYHEEVHESGPEHDEFIADGGTNLEYYEDDDGFYEYVRDVVEDEARDAFENDDEFWESVEDAEEYRRDPYAYYGVSRWDFV